MVLGFGFVMGVGGVGFRRRSRPSLLIALPADVGENLWNLICVWLFVFCVATGTRVVLSFERCLVGLDSLFSCPLRSYESFSTVCSQSFS